MGFENDARESDVTEMSDTDKCPECGATLENAPGIGPYCPKKGCPYVDGYPSKMIDLLFQKREKKEMSEKGLIPCPPGFELVPEGTTAFLKRIEWCGWDQDGIGADIIQSLCPCCRLHEDDGHTDDCFLNAILTRHRATQQGMETLGEQSREDGKR